MELSIVIVNWNTRQLLEACLESVYQNAPTCEMEVWVVDNVSTDGSPGMVADKFPQVKLIRSRENGGFARGNNQAIRQVQGKYVLLLNPDTKILGAALQTLVDFLDENPGVGAVGSRLLNADESLQVSCYPRPTLFRELWRMFHFDLLLPYAVYDMPKWDVTQPRPVDVLMGACLLVRKAVFDQVGLLDESYFIYSEEVDLCLRIQRGGHTLFWVPQAQVVHYGGQSTKQMAGEMFLHLYQSKIQYFRKHYGWLAAQAYKLILMTATIGRLLVSPLAFLEEPSQRNRHLSLSQNYRRLLFALPSM